MSSSAIIKENPSFKIASSCLLACVEPFWPHVKVLFTPCHLCNEVVWGGSMQSTSLQGKLGVQGAYALVGSSSSASNLLERPLVPYCPWWDSGQGFWHNGEWFMTLTTHLRYSVLWECFTCVVFKVVRLCSMCFSLPNFFELHQSIIKRLWKCFTCAWSGSTLSNFFQLQHILGKQFCESVTDVFEVVWLLQTSWNYSTS